MARASIDLTPRYEGRLQAVYVRLGDVVPAGGRIATIESSTVRFDLVTAEATLRAAEAEHQKAVIELAEAQERLQRRESLSAEALASQEELATARYGHKLARVGVEIAQSRASERRTHVDRLRRLSADAEILAPFEGIVAVRYADPGANVTAATPIVRLLSSGELIVRFAVPEATSGALSVGRTVHVAAENSTATAIGTIEKIAPEIDTASRMLVLEARIAPGSGSLRVGEITRVLLEKPR